MSDRSSITSHKAILASSLLNLMKLDIKKNPFGFKPDFYQFLVGDVKNPDNRKMIAGKKWDRIAINHCTDPTVVAFTQKHYQIGEVPDHETEARSELNIEEAKYASVFPGDPFHVSIVLCDRFFDETKSGKLEQILTLLHEGQHTFSQDPGHVTCSRGSSTGQAGGCDSKYFDGRSAEYCPQSKFSGYNQEAYFLKQLIINGKIDSLQLKIAKTQLDYLVNNRFNSITNDQIGEALHLQPDTDDDW